MATTVLHLKRENFIAAAEWMGGKVDLREEDNERKDCNEFDCMVLHNEVIGECNVRGSWEEEEKTG